MASTEVIREPISMVPSHDNADSARENPVEVVTSILKEYASRGVFAGFRQAKRQTLKAEFTVQWHFRQILTIRVDATRSTLTLPNLIPHASAAPNVRSELSAFLRHCASQERPAHRRIKWNKCRITCSVRNDNLSLRVDVLDGDFAYATCKLVHLVNEIFLDFLREAQYVEYMVAHMGMNPETGGSL